MLLRTEVFKIHAVCATNEDVPESLISPDFSVMNLFRADNKVDLPQPMHTHTHTHTHTHKPKHRP